VFEILENTVLAPRVNRYRVKAPDIAKKAQPGQFVILRIDETGERIPVTIADFDREAGTLTFYVQQVGKTTIQMAALKAGEVITDLAGPLGKASAIDKVGTVVAVGGGFGIAALYPIVRALTHAGNTTISLLGARTAELVILEDEMRVVSSDVRVATEDGSRGIRGRVTDLWDDLLKEGRTVNQMIAIGPVVMMQAMAERTRLLGIPTLVSMNPIMMDGTGMCGACRVMVDGKMQFACVDGPEFDGHRVDFKALVSRLNMYKEEEKTSLDNYNQKRNPDCAVEPLLK